MINSLLAKYQGAINSKFAVVISEGIVELELFEVTDNGSTLENSRFSLLFKGPAEKFLQQDIYQIRHEQLGELDLFMVPLGAFQDGFKYEILFNN
jgi:hypothetical protein